MQKLITRVALSRFGVQIFENEVNSYMEAGWDLVEYDVEPGFLRIVCTALFEKACNCACCQEKCSCNCDCCKKHQEP